MRRRRAKLGVVLATLALAGAGTALAAVRVDPRAAGAETTGTTTGTTATGGTTTTIPRVTLSLLDSRFIRQAALSDRLEIRTGRLATARGSGSVRAFGAMLVRDHTLSSRKLARAAAEVPFRVVATLPKAKLRLVAQLQTLRTSAFVRTFARLQVATHQQAIALFSREAAKGTHPALRAFARAQLPVLRMHLKTAKRLAMSV
jgi:putative membrane protein